MISITLVTLSSELITCPGCKLLQIAFESKKPVLSRRAFRILAASDLLIAHFCTDIDDDLNRATPPLFLASLFNVCSPRIAIASLSGYLSWLCTLKPANVKIYLNPG